MRTGVAALCACAWGCSGDPSTNVDRSAGMQTRVQSRAGAGNSAASATGGASALDFGMRDAGSPPGRAPANTTPPANAPNTPPPGTFKPQANLDPNITFDWTETARGQTTMCQDGTYSGTFDCTFSDPSGTIPDVDVSGPVTLTFMKSMDGEFLEISNGNFQAVGNLFIGAEAKIVGKLDCQTLMLTAMATDGQWAIGDPNAPLIPGGMLTGDITGTLDPATGTLSGQWNFGDPSLGACPGTWSVMYTP